MSKSFSLDDDVFDYVVAHSSPLDDVQATWASSKRHPHWAPPALVFRAPARLAGPRPALPAAVKTRAVARSGRWRVLRAAAATVK